MEIAHQFQGIANELVAVQRELSHLYRLASDPLIEAQSQDRRADLCARRDALLAHWGRLGLTWLLQGGAVQLVEAPPRVTEAPANTPDAAAGQVDGAAAPAPAPAPATLSFVAPERGQDYGTYTRPSLSPSWSRPTPPPVRSIPVDVDKLRDVLKSFDPPPTVVEEESTVREELRRLAENTSPLALSLWTEFPKDIQRALVGLSVARARFIQDEISPALHPITIEQELDRFFSGMTAFSKREQPGFVFGLRRHHHPVAERWAEDAQRWWAELTSHLPEPITPNPERALEELRTAIEEGGEEEIIAAALGCLDANVAPEDPRYVRLMIPHSEKLRKHTRFKRLRKAIRDMMTEDEAVEAESVAEDTSVPEEWPHFTLTREHRAVIIGGDAREEARARIQTAFGFANVEWVSTDHSRNVQNVANAIRGGSVDFVILLRRFIGHNVDRTVLPAARAAGIPWVSVERGYGVQQVKSAIERFTTTGDEG